MSGVAARARMLRSAASFAQIERCSASRSATTRGGGERARPSLSLASSIFSILLTFFTILFDNDCNSVRWEGMDALWTLPELVAEVTARIAALPAPKNGQVRAVPDERTVRYYVTLGLLDRPSATRGRTALYGSRHAAQVVAIKRLRRGARSLKFRPCGPRSTIRR